MASFQFHDISMHSQELPTCRILRFWCNKLALVLASFCDSNILLGCHLVMIDSTTVRLASGGSLRFTKVDNKFKCLARLRRMGLL